MMVALKGRPSLKALHSPTWFQFLAFVAFRSSLDSTDDLAASRPHPLVTSLAWLASPGPAPRPRLLLIPPWGPRPRRLHCPSEPIVLGPASPGSAPLAVPGSLWLRPRLLAPPPTKARGPTWGYPLALPKGRAPNPGDESPAEVRHAGHV